MMLVGKRSSGTTLLSGSGLGRLRPLSEADEYLSPKPLTYTYLPRTRLRPVSLVRAIAILSSPVLSISDESNIAEISDVSLFSSGMKDPLTTTSSISWALINNGETIMKGKANFKKTKILFVLFVDFIFTPK